jgi:hypothetical protein
MKMVLPKPKWRTESKGIQGAETLAAMHHQPCSFQPNPHVLSDLYDDDVIPPEEMGAFYAAPYTCLFKHMHIWTFVELELHRFEMSAHHIFVNLYIGAIANGNSASLWIPKCFQGKGLVQRDGATYLEGFCC